MFNQYPYQNLQDLNLDWFLKKFKEILTAVETLTAWKDEHEQEYEDLKKAVDDLESGNWTPEFIGTLVDWYRDNIVNIIGEMVKQVFFGLTDSGYFVVYIPDSWQDITFATTEYDTVEAMMPEFGHLVLKY